MTGLACESGGGDADADAGRQFARQTKAGDCSELSQDARSAGVLAQERTPTVPAAAPEVYAVCLISLSLQRYQETTAAGAREDASERAHACCTSR